MPINDPFVGEIMIGTWTFVPRGWALCNGQLLPINQNQALFSLLGTYYGGNGQTNFALPDLRGRVPIGMSADQINQPTYPLATPGGQEAVTLGLSELPQHAHAATVTAPLTTATACSSVAGDRRTPVDNRLAVEAMGVTALYSAAAPNSQMRADAVRFGGAAAIGNAGGGQPHNNVQPCLALSFFIALVGAFPPR